MIAALEGATEERRAADAGAPAVGRGVTTAIAYTPGSTSAHTTAAEALEQGEGVCQDHAHALIAVAHAAGMPARYVAGYLLSRDDERHGGGEPRLGGDVRAEPRLDRL